MTTANSYLAAWLDASGLRPYHIDKESVPWRYYFHDLPKVEEVENVWKTYTGGGTNYRNSHKRLTSTKGTA